MEFIYDYMEVCEYLFNPHYRTGCIESYISCCVYCVDLRVCTQN